MRHASLSELVRSAVVRNFASSPVFLTDCSNAVFVGFVPSPGWTISSGLFLHWILDRTLNSSTLRRRGTTRRSYSFVPFL